MFPPGLAVAADVESGLGFFYRHHVVILEAKLHAGRDREIRPTVTAVINSDNLFNKLPFLMASSVSLIARPKYLP